MVIQKSIKFSKYIESFAWDVLLKRQENTSVPYLNQVYIAIRSRRRSTKAHYFFRFFQNMFIQKPTRLYFRTPRKVQHLTHSRRKRFSRFHIHLSRKNWQSYAFAYVLIFNLLPHDGYFLYVYKRIPTTYCALKLIGLTSFRVLPLHDFYGDADWTSMYLYDF